MIAIATSGCRITRRLARAFFLVGIATSTLVLRAGPTAAQESATSNPSDLDRQARAAFEQGDFAKAAKLFDQAFALSPHSRSKLNAGVAHDRAGNLARAADAYEAAVGMPEELPESERASAEARLEVLKQRLASVYVPNPTGARVEVGDRSFQVPARFHLDPGRHVVIVRSVEGHKQQHSVSAQAGDLIVLRQPATSLAPVTAPPPRARRAAAPPKRKTAPAKADAGPGPWPWVAFGGAGAFSALGVTFGLMTNSAVDDFVAEGQTDAGSRDRAVNLRAASFVSFGLAAVSATIGVVLLAADGGGGERNAKPARRSWEIVAF